MSETVHVTSGRKAYDLVHESFHNLVSIAEAEKGRYHIGDKVIATSRDHHQVEGTVTWVDDPNLLVYWLAD